jgi:hypothetical protein
LEKPLPVELIRKMTEFGVRESLENDGKWRTPTAAGRKTPRR